MIFDHMTIVVGDRHANSVQALIPEWWGVYQATWNGRRVASLTRVKPPKENENVNALMLLRLLRSVEVVNILKTRGLGERLRMLKCYELDSMVASLVSLREIKREVRLALKNREHWRVDSQHT